MAPAALRAAWPGRGASTASRRGGRCATGTAAGAAPRPRTPCEPEQHHDGCERHGGSVHTTTAAPPCASATACVPALRGEAARQVDARDDIACKAVQGRVCSRASGWNPGCRLALVSVGRAPRHPTASRVCVVLPSSRTRGSRPRCARWTMTKIRAPGRAGWPLPCSGFPPTARCTPYAGRCRSREKRARSATAASVRTAVSGLVLPCLPCGRTRRQGNGTVPLASLRPRPPSPPPPPALVPVLQAPLLQNDEARARQRVRVQVDRLLRGGRAERRLVDDLDGCVLAQAAQVEHDVDHERALRDVPRAPRVHLVRDGPALRRLQRVLTARRAPSKTGRCQPRRHSTLVASAAEPGLPRCWMASRAARRSQSPPRAGGPQR